MTTKILLIYLLLLLFFADVNSQVSAEIKIPAIPYPLHWQNKPANFMAGKNSITITAGKKTDMFRDPNVTYNTDNAPKLLFTPDSNFILTASIEHPFTSKWDGGAIVLIADSLNWIKFCFEKDYTGAKRVVSVVTRNISDDCNSVKINSTKVFYKIAKADDVITLYYSVNGVSWFLVRHFQFPVTSPLQVGFLSQSPTGSRCKVTFSNIFYKAKKIKDPYTGE